MNCSESRRLQRLLSRLWQELRGGRGGPEPSNGSSPWALLDPAGASPKRAEEEDASLHLLLLVVIFCGCLAGGLILAYARSRRLESSKHDPSSRLGVERDWTERGLAEAAAATGTPGERHDGERP